MARYSPEEYLVAIGDAVDDNGFLRIDRVGGKIAELSITRFLVFLDTGWAAAESRGCDWSEREGNWC